MNVASKCLLACPVCASDVGLVSAAESLSPFQRQVQVDVESPPNHSPPPTGNAATMPDPELVALASDIRELSLILSADNSDNWRPHPINQGPVQDGHSRALSHISSILSVDSDAPVAVVGSMTQDNTAIVVQSMTSESAEPSHRPIAVRSITPSSRDVYEILDDEPEDVEVRAAECLALFAARQESRITSRMILEWVVSRYWYTLQARLKRSKDNFQFGDLFDLMENWAPAFYDNIPRRPIPLPPVSEVYLKYGLDVCRHANGETTFSLSEDTASTLINTLAKILKDVQRTMEPDDSVDYTTAVKSIADSLLFSCYVVADKAMQRVFTHTSLAEVLAPTSLRDYAENVAQALDDGWDPLTLADCDDDSDFALRYLRMLTRPALAVLVVTLPNTLHLFAAAKVTVISLLKSPHAPDSACDRVTQSVFDEIQRNLKSESEACEEALKWVRDLVARKLDKSSSSCYVHAVAGVMALACDGRPGHKGYGEYEMINREVPTQACVAQRCCVLCFRMGELLNQQLGDDLKFVLPGTHDVILPWDPPLFGIPISVMRKLRDELRELLVDFAIRQGKRNVSITNLRPTQE